MARRVWAPTIGEALQTMVNDRQTDFALEHIEQVADGEAEEWWNTRETRVMCLSGCADWRQIIQPQSTG